MLHHIVHPAKTRGNLAISRFFVMTSAASSARKLTSLGKGLNDHRSSGRAIARRAARPSALESTRSSTTRESEGRLLFQPPFKLVLVRCFPRAISVHWQSSTRCSAVDLLRSIEGRMTATFTAMACIRHGASPFIDSFELALLPGNRMVRAWCDQRPPESRMAAETFAAVVVQVAGGRRMTRGKIAFI